MTNLKVLKRVKSVTLLRPMFSKQLVGLLLIKISKTWVIKCSSIFMGLERQ
jgi:hypothetical protein